MDLTFAETSQFPTIQPNFSLDFGGTLIELKRLKEISGHDDSIPFCADLYINYKKIASVMDDGWGGPLTYSNITPNCDKLIDETKEKVKKYDWLIKGEAYPYDLDMAIQEIVYRRLSFSKTIKKYENECIISYDPRTDKLLKNLLKGKPQDINKLMMEKPNMVLLLINIIHNKGEIVVNTNIAKKFLKYTV